jgi:hypothetical protein
LWHLQKFLQYIKCIITWYISIILPIFPSSIHGIVSTGLIFSIYIYVYTVFATYSLSYIFSPLHPSSHWYQPSPPDLWSCEKMTYFLFKIAIQGVSLSYFHVYMYYNPNWFFSIFLLSTLVFFLCDLNRFKNSIFILT